MAPGVIAHVPQASEKQSVHVPAHRQQMPLPRPAIAYSHTFNGPVASLGRRNRYPSTTNLTARFEPAMYPLPLSINTMSHHDAAPAPLPNPPGPHPAPSTVGSQIEMGNYVDTPVLSTPFVHRSDDTPLVRRSAEQLGQSPDTGSGAAYKSSSAEVPRLNENALVTSKERPLPPCPAPSPSMSKDLQTEGHVSVSRAPDVDIFTESVIQVSAADRMKNSSSSIPFLAVSQSTSDLVFRGQGEGQPDRTRWDDDHVSFEVPSGKRGRLRVSLAWLRDAGSPRRPHRPPPLPPVPTKSPIRPVNRLPEISSNSEPSKVILNEPPAPTVVNQWNNPYYPSPVIPHYASQRVHQMQTPMPPFPYQQPGAGAFAWGPHAGTHLGRQQTYPPFPPSSKPASSIASPSTVHPLPAVSPRFPIYPPIRSGSRSSSE